VKPDRRLGRTGLEVSAVGLGTYCLTLDWGVSVASARQTLREAANTGVNLFDTAPMYGGGQAQALVGAASADQDAGLTEAVLVDKVGRFEHSILRRRVEQAYRDPELIEGQFRHSLSLLGRDRVDVVLIHESDWPQWWADAPVADAPVMRTLARLRDAGHIGHIGLSVRDVPGALRLVETGLFDVVLYVHYHNLVWQELTDELFSRLTELDVGLIIGAPYRRGILLRDDETHLAGLAARRNPDIPPGAVERLRQAGALARTAHLTLAELGLRFLLSDPRIHSVLVGAESPAQLRLNVAAADRGPLDSDLLDQVTALRDIPLGSW
jgi:aryl-alcohol dehydrogenase-like predicted oxidoreductase